MANKIIKNTLRHYNEVTSESFTPDPPAEPDKSKSISELSQEELRNMIGRLGAERELESIIRELKRNSGERDTYENPFVVDTTTPIDQLYHYGIIGMKWGRRRYQNEDGTRTAAGKKRDRGGALQGLPERALRRVHAGAHGARRVCLYAEKPQVRSLPHAELLPCI